MQSHDGIVMIKCVERLRTFLLGRPFVVVTDCQAFQLTMAKKNATAKIARWALLLEEYDMTVKHRPGTSMKHVDALSRNAVMLVETSVFMAVKRAQMEDEQCQLMVKLVEKGGDTKHVVRSGALYSFQDGYYKIVVPEVMVPSLLRQFHGDTHLSARKMEQLIHQDYQIAGLSKKIDKLISNCITCILAKNKQGKKDGWLRQGERTAGHISH